jgi:hypothetical protein
MNCKCLLDKIRQRTLVLLNGYLQLPSIETVIVTSQFGADAGLMGTIVLAQTALFMDEDDSSKSLKKHEAFMAGLWHGALVGFVGTAVVCKYWFFNSKRKK